MLATEAKVLRLVLEGREESEIRPLLCKHLRLNQGPMVTELLM